MHRTFKVLVAAGCALSMAAPCLGSDAADYLDFDLESLMDMDVVYGASTYEQKVSEAPSSVTIITSEEIEAYGYRNLVEALNSVAGYFSSYDRNYEYVGIRGFGRPGDYNTRLLVLVDGHRINDGIYQTGMIGNEFPVDIELVKRIEIVRGPSSSLYGGSAFFGVINVLTKNHEDMDGSELAGQFSSFRGFGGRYSFGKTIQDDISLLFSVSGFSVDGDDLFYQEFATRDNNSGIAEGADDDQAQRVFAKVAGENWELSGAWSKREKGIPTAAWGIIFNDPGSRTFDTRGYLSLGYTKPTGENSQLNLKGFYDIYDYEGAYRVDYTEDGGEPWHVTNWDTSINKSWGLEARWDAKLGSRHRLLAGAEYRNHFERYQDNFDADPDYWLYLATDEPGTSYGLYAQDEILLREGVKLNLGVRYDTSDNYDSVNPRLALMLNPKEGSTVKALYGTAFRAPNAYELYYGDEDWQFPNPDLDPETMESFELVWEQVVGKGASAALSFFNYSIDELITQVEDPEEVFTFMNLDHVQSSGLELSVDSRLSGRLQGRASYSCQDTRDSATDELLSNSPQHMGKLNILGKFPTTGTAAGVEWIYVGERRTLADATADGHLLTNLSGSWSFFQDQVILSGTVYNLFDVAYADPGSGEHFQDVLPRDGRTFRAKLMYSF